MAIFTFIRIGIAVVVVFFLWAAFTNVNELVKGDGKVVPSSQLQVLQSIDGGIVQQIFVKEGDKVELRIKFRDNKDVQQVSAAKFYGEVKYVDPRVEITSRVKVLAYVENVDGLLKEGLRGEMTIMSAEPSPFRPSR